MTDTAAKQLKRILHVLPEIADGKEHKLSVVSRRVGIPKDVLLADLKSLADHQEAPGGYVEDMEIFIGPDRVSVRSDEFLRPMGLTAGELCALELGLAVLRAERPPDETAVIERARERLHKVMQRLPRGSGMIETRYAEVAPTEGLPHLNEVRRALRDRKKISITYRGATARASTTRTVRPYAVVAASGMWYAVAYCEESEGLRVFRMDRVEGAASLAERYEVPETFSVSETLREGRALQVDSHPPGLKVRYSPRIARWIAEREGLPLDADGSVTIEHPLADHEWGVRHTLQYGPDAEVLEPAEVRKAVAERVREILRA
jgi:proteasome accessory factor C